MRSFDAIVIGAGQAGPFLAARMVATGLKVALIERKFLGGTCVNAGCMPTKTLVASARAAHVARRGGERLRLLGCVDAAEPDRHPAPVVEHRDEGVAVLHPDAARLHAARDCAAGCLARTQRRPRRGRRSSWRAAARQHEEQRGQEQSAASLTGGSHRASQDIIADPAGRYAIGLIPQAGCGRPAALTSG